MSDADEATELTHTPAVASKIAEERAWGGGKGGGWRTLDLSEDLKVKVIEAATATATGCGGGGGR